MAPRVKWVLCALTCLAALLTAATMVQAVVQAPKNGCTSPESYEGSITSPPFTPAGSIEFGAGISFRGWFEVESIDPAGHDTTVIEYRTPADPAGTWNSMAPNGDLFGQSTPPVGFGLDQPYSNRGTNAPPAFQNYLFTLPTATNNVAGTQIRIRFRTFDTAYQGFRGVGIDNVSIDTTSGKLTTGFETGDMAGWTLDPASGPGAPFWQALASPENVIVKNPEVNPDLVTLQDAGALPAVEIGGGSRYAWFGNVDSGTFCGPDFAQRPDFTAPETSITDGPSGTTASTDASFSFTATEPAFFECQLDGGPLTSCESPQSYTGLSAGTHTFSVQATDLSENTDPTPATWSWTIDATAPETTITDGPSGSTDSKDASFSFTASEPASFRCQLDGGPTASCASPRPYTGLSNGTHTFSVQAIDVVGNADSTPAVRTWTIREATLADLPKPELGVDVNIDQVKGTVLVGIPTGAVASGSARASQKGVRFVPLSEARQVPVGSFLDTRKGTVRLQSAVNSAGKRQSGDFFGGLFQVKQSRKRSAKGLTDLILKGSSFRRCGSGKRASAALSRAAIRRLRASASGRFRTSGQNSSATVRGTVWDVTDRCDGTLTKVRRGKVIVRDFRRKKNITLTTGKSYLARAPG